MSKGCETEIHKSGTISFAKENKPNMKHLNG